MKASSNFLKTKNPNIFILSPTNTPIIGSGKISRYVFIKNPSPQKRKWKKNGKIDRNRQRKFIPVVEQTKQETEKVESTRFGSVKIKLLFNFWCSLGHPMITHGIGSTKTFHRCISALKKKLKKYEFEQIIAAMRLANETFNSGWFIHKKYIQSTRIGLPSFFEYNRFDKDSMPEKMQNINSWLEEFMNGEEYIQKNYSIILKDKHPYTTKDLTQSWVKYTNDYNHELTITEKNSLVRISKMVVQFADANSHMYSPGDITDIIEQMMNYWEPPNKFKPAHLGWMLSKIFWEQTLPKALLFFNPHLDSREINRIF